MTKFTDTAGREWVVSLTVPDARAIRSLLDVDIFNMESGLPKVLADPVLLVDVLWVVVRRQHPDVTDEDFGRSLAGDAFGAAAEALVQAFVNFYPPRQRAILELMLQMREQLETSLTGLALEKLPEMVERIEELAAGGNTSPAARESSAAVGAAPSANSPGPPNSD